MSIRLPVLIALLASLSDPALSQTEPEPDVTVSPTIDRTEWQARIAAARERVKANIERAKAQRSFAPFIPTYGDDPKVASERAMNDASLQYGDVISTVDGLYVFIGRDSQNRTQDDFVALKKP